MKPTDHLKAVPPILDLKPVAYSTAAILFKQDYG